jgi:hypothetical protein
MSSMRDDLGAALDEAGEDYDETVQTIEVAPEDDTTDDTDSGDTTTENRGADTSDNEGDTSANADGKSTNQDAEGQVPKTSKDGESVQAGDTKTLGAGDSIKAPVDWGPQDREAWSKIPRHLQEKVMAREKDMSNMMQTTADARRTHDQFSKLTQQYGSALSGVMGDSPMETVSNLFDTVANLRMGSPIQKAQIVADLIQNFGVDINTLDSAIVGAAPSQQDQQSNEVQRLVAEQMAPFQEMMGQQNAYKHQQEQQRVNSANTEVAEFSTKAEFLNDVRHDMADLIQMAGSRGQHMTMQDAYDKCCAMNPQIAGVLAERAQRTALTGGSNTMAAKRLAASSVNGTRGGSGGGGTAMSMHDTISAAWDNAGQI